MTDLLKAYIAGNKITIQHGKSEYNYTINNNGSVSYEPAKPITAEQFIKQLHSISAQLPILVKEAMQQSNPALPVLPAFSAALQMHEIMELGKQYAEQISSWVNPNSNNLTNTVTFAPNVLQAQNKR